MTTREKLIKWGNAEVREDGEIQLLGKSKLPEGNNAQPFYRVELLSEATT